jgi:hypothetical protein
MTATPANAAMIPPAITPVCEVELLNVARERPGVFMTLTGTLQPKILVSLPLSDTIKIYQH